MPQENVYQNNEALLRRAQAGDASARDEVYAANLGLVNMVLERFRNSSSEYEDLFQIGAIGLLKAIDRFDFSYGVRFSTYAVPMIIGEIKRFLRDDGIIRVQRSVRENYWRIRQAREKLQTELGREPRLTELAEELDLEREDIVLALEACQSPTSIDEEYHSADDKETGSLLDRLIGEDGSAAMLEQVALREAIARLNAREQEIILRRYFRDETQTAIAVDLALSQVQISRIEKQALKKMRELMDQG